ncbi:hypothetical protein BGX30_014383 [Mortierella sp. GBA39]|nr:hypothetical protein BGX30_014383 [Mortierella sp. GBA39]
MSEKIEDPQQKGDLQVEEAEHHEHADEISPELEALLKTDPKHGLTTAEAAERLARFGPNELAEVKRNPFLKFLGYFTGAIAYLIEVACIISAVVEDWLDFGIILALLIVNACIGFIEESKAESALDALRQTLALKTRCWRDGHLVELDVSVLVPGDIIVLRLGDIIPADGRLLGIGATGEATEGDLLIDQSALTGESLPVAKNKGKTVYSSSIVKQGQQMAVTGTLTLNELTFDEPYLSNNYTSDDILLYSYLAAEAGANDPIEFAVRTAAEAQLTILQGRTHKHEVPGFKVTSFLPFNPSTKLTQATITNLSTNSTFKVAKGAPQVIIKLVGGDDDAVRAVNSLAKRGLRALGVARTVEGNMDQWELIGMISLIDPPRPDSAETIRRCNDMGVAVKMITGDQLIIAKEVAHRLGMQRVMLDAGHLVDPTKSEEEVTEHVIRADGFAHVIPEHKYRVVELLQKRGILVGMTGDGVNDAPALKKANVGIAVHGCTDAARSAADIVLLAPGLSTIVDGLMTSRAIFQRMRSYALYRITSTVHFLMFFFVVVMAYDWSLPPHLLILICILNDLATLVIAVDNAQISQHPDKWRIGQLITMSIVLGALLCALSFAHFFIFWKVYGYEPKNSPHGKDVTNDMKIPDELRKLESIMYLHISSAPHFVIFSTRLTGYFWENLPSPIFAIVIIGTQIIALLMVIFGGLTPKVPAGQAIVVLLISFIYFIILDVVKVQIFKRWSFKLTATLVPTDARRTKLGERNAAEIQQKRVWESIDQVRKVAVMTAVVSSFAEKSAVVEEEAK